MKNKPKKEYVLVNKKVTKFLKTPLPRKFVEHVSLKPKIIIFSLIFLVILIASINKLGTETGIYFAIGFSVCVVFVYLKSQHDLKVSAEIRKKYGKKTIKDSESD